MLESFGQALNEGVAEEEVGPIRRMLLISNNLEDLLHTILVQKSNGIRFCGFRPKLFIVICNLSGYRQIASRRGVNELKIRFKEYR